MTRRARMKMAGADKTGHFLKEDWACPVRFPNSNTDQTDRVDIHTYLLTIP